MDAKTYFSHYLADDQIRQLNRDLVNEILKFEPKSCFEFGCGQGKNLALLKGLGLSKINGIDISSSAIESGRKRFALNLNANQRIYVGDENTLAEKIKHGLFDVSFTCSVLDHIEHEITVDHIIADLKRISKKAVILYETQRHTPGSFYYRHNYEDYGFTKLDYEYLSKEQDGGDGSVYSMWLWERSK
jgi:ubiquinone/menaquinone biosynthesis C-methylase UbiE